MVRLFRKMSQNAIKLVFVVEYMNNKINVLTVWTVMNFCVIF